jgi:hypothetical protein
MTSSTLSGSEGPVPYSRWLTASEYRSAHDLALKLACEMQFEGVSLWDDFLPPWRVIEIPLADTPGRKILIVLQRVDGEWRPIRTRSFFLVAAPAPDEKHKHIAIIDLAKVARLHIEDLVAALGWPADDTALHRAIDRCLELEEQGPHASR